MQENIARGCNGLEILEVTLNVGGATPLRSKFERVDFARKSRFLKVCRPEFISSYFSLDVYKVWSKTNQEFLFNE